MFFRYYLKQKKYNIDWNINDLKEKIKIKRDLKQNLFVHQNLS